MTFRSCHSFTAKRHSLRHSERNKRLLKSDSLSSLPTPPKFQLRSHSFYKLANRSQRADPASSHARSRSNRQSFIGFKTNIHITPHQPSTSRPNGTNTTPTNLRLRDRPRHLPLTQNQHVGHILLRPASPHVLCRRRRGLPRRPVLSGLAAQTGDSSAVGSRAVWL